MTFTVAKNREDVDIDLEPYKDNQINATLAWHASSAAVTVVANADINVSGGDSPYPSIPVTMDGETHKAYVDFIGIAVNEIQFAFARFNVERPAGETIYFISIRYSNLDGWIVNPTVIVDESDGEGQDFADISLIDQLRFLL